MYTYAYKYTYKYGYTWKIQLNNIVECGYMRVYCIFFQFFFKSNFL